MILEEKNQKNTKNGKNDGRKTDVEELEKQNLRLDIELKKEQVKAQKLSNYILQCKINKLKCDSEQDGWEMPHNRPVRNWKFVGLFCQHLKIMAQIMNDIVKKSRRNNSNLF